MNAPAAPLARSTHRRLDRSQLVRDVDRAAIRAALVDWTVSTSEQKNVHQPLTLLEVRNRASRVAIRRVDYEASRKDCELETLTSTLAQAIELDAKQLPNQKHVYTLEGYWGEASYPEAEVQLTCLWLDPDDDADSGGSIMGGGGRGKDAVGRAFGALTELVGKQIKTHSSDWRAQLASKDQEIQRLQSRVDTLESGRDDLVKAREAALNEAQDRTMKLERNRELMKGAKELLGMVKMFGPIIVNRIAGEQIIPVPAWANPIVEQLSQIHEAITEDDEVMGAVLNALSKSPRALALFGDFMSNLQNAKTKELAKAHNAVAAEEAGEAARAELEAAERKKKQPRGPLARLLYNIVDE